MRQLSDRKAELLDTYPYLVELHAHSRPVSICSEVPAPEVAERYHALGAHALVLTNHVFPDIKSEPKEAWIARYVKDFQDAKARGDALGLQVLLGLELRFPDCDNDYLVYGVDEALLPVVWDLIDTDLHTFYAACHSPGRVIVQAHPFRNGMKLAEPGDLDGIEVYNMHPNHNSRVAMAAAYHTTTGGVLTGGSDFHHPGQEGMLFACFRELPRDSFHLAQLLRSGNYIFRMGDSVLLP